MQQPHIASRLPMKLSSAPAPRSAALAVLLALGACRRRVTGVHFHELAGPEPIVYRDLIIRAAAMMGREVSPGTLPVWIAKAGAALKSRMSGGGMTPAVIDVITANEHVAHNADADLGITLTPLAETLAKILPGRTSI